MRKVFANLVYIVIGLPLTLSALFLFAAAPWAGDKAFYRRIVDDDRLYAAIKAPETARNAPDLVRLGGASFDGHALVSALQKNLPQAELKALGDGLVDQIFAASVAGNLPAPRLDLRPLKTTLRGRSRAIAADYVAALPTRPDKPAEGDFTWRASALPAAAETADVSALLGASLDKMPDTAGQLGTARRLLPGPALFRFSPGRSAPLLAGLSALLISGLAYLGANGAGRRLARAGKMILLPSLLVLVGGVMLLLPGLLVQTGLLPEALRPLVSGTAGSALAAYLASVFGAVAKSFFVTGLVGSSLGGLLISARRIAEPREIE